MYRFRERKHGHQKFYASLIVFALLGGLSMVVGVQYLKPNTRISSPPKPAIGHVTTTQPITAQISEPLFTLALPNDWKARSNTDVPQPSYSWHGTAKDDDTRWINVYADTIPNALAVNRVLPVVGAGATLSLPNDVSENCTTFTGATQPNQTSVMAKWQGITFLCDTGNYIRDVVGTSSLEGVNSVSLSTTASGNHHFFFTYTDNSSSPDYTTFTNALKSFRLK